MVTPQTNITLAEMAQKLTLFESFAICGHVSPDGDCLGSQLALAHALKLCGKKVVCLLANTDPIENNLKFLPGINDMIVGSEYTETPDAFIAVDVPTKDRMKTAGAVLDRTPVSFTIDHHKSDKSMSDYVFVDPASPSASMLVWQVATYLGAIDENVALCALTGLITDTGRFSYQNTTAEAFRFAAEMVQAGASPSLITREFFQNRSLASLALERVVLERMVLTENGKLVVSYLKKEDFDTYGAIKADAEPLIDSLRNVSGIRVALILRENADGEVRGSLRAKDDITDVSSVARVFGGGGHKAAAGFTYKGALEDALTEVPNKVSQLCFACFEAGK